VGKEDGVKADPKASDAKPEAKSDEGIEEDIMTDPEYNEPIWENEPIIDDFSVVVQCPMC
ncbi:hypothetical protein A2U01_0066644, partial [Trifolium medium]|nr:hypothetical protein [Trifolium medium]